MGPAQAPVRGPVEDRTSSVTLSVVVPAYDRREFLLEALRSVAQQSSNDPSTPEVVVIKNFEEPAIEDAIRAAGARSIHFGSRTYGATIARAVRECHGEVIAFLEDDDRFAGGKLARVREVFALDPGVVFYHNDYEEIDGRGIRAPASSQRRAIDRRVAGRSSERYDGVEKTAQFARIGDSVPSAHMSCLAMRRSLLLLVLDRLERVPIGVDFFLFFVGVAGEGAMVVDPAKLTQYRRHAANSSRALSFDPASYLELVAGSRTMAAETRGAVEALGGVSILPWLEAELAAHALYVATAAPRPQRRAVGDALLGVLRGPRSLAGVERPSQWLRSWLFLVSPHLAARLLRPRVRTDFVEAHGP